MQPRITVLTVCVDDLERSVTFYRDGLGLKTQGIIGREFEHGAVALFDLHGGLRLALWPRNSLARDSPASPRVNRALPSFPLAIMFLPGPRSMR